MLPLLFVLSTLQTHIPVSPLTTETRKVVQEAQHDFQAGHRQHAKEIVESLLLLPGATVGFEKPNADTVPLTRALDAWGAVLPDCPIVAAMPGQKPQIVIHITDGIGGPQGGSDVQGQVAFSRAYEEPDHLLHADIYVCNRIDNRALTAKEEGAILTHELGHILGLGDSLDGTGIMGEFDPDELVTRPSKEEADALICLRLDLKAKLAEFARR